jgi:acetyl-CoA carboxylase, biotin carboxylase subunit
MGDKAVARETMIREGVPVVPGSDGAIDDPEKALKVAHEIGFPVLVKAAAGGGGKGMRVAPDEATFEKAFQAAQNEAAGGVRRRHGLPGEVPGEAASHRDPGPG